MDLHGKEVRVKAGEPLDLNIPLVGSPTPTIDWLKEGINVQPTLTTVIEADENHTRLYIPISKRSDSGLYTIKATNNLGEAKADVKVIVIDKPGEPEGPLQYPEITKHSVQLAWKPPKDDGGTEIVGKLFSL